MNNTLAAVGILAAIAGGIGIGLAGSSESAVLGGVPVFAIAVAAAFMAQWIAFVPAFLAKSERYFDLLGSATFIGVVLLALAAKDQLDLRSSLIAAMVVIWALRLGSFLFRRIRAQGYDRRFRNLKGALPFLMTWSLQGLWVSVTAACALAALTARAAVAVDWTLVAGALLWALGLAIEVVADGQKQRFRAVPENAERFIDTGLWARSRHPNYFGEIALWAGIALVAMPTLQGWSYVTLVSPIFVWLLLTRISGVRMLETRAKRKWGDDPAYQAYLAWTPTLVPRLGRPPNSNG